MVRPSTNECDLLTHRAREALIHALAIVGRDPEADAMRGRPAESQLVRP